MAVRKLTPRTRQMLLVSLIACCWTLAAALAFAGSATQNRWWYFGAIVFFLNGFLPLPALQYVRALDETPEKAREMLLGRMPPRKKRNILAILVAFCWTVAGVEALLGWSKNDSGWYIPAMSLFVTGLGFLEIRRNVRIPATDGDP
jgi:hypothetical protein